MRKDLDIILASPRGFCAGVERAIDIVEKALVKFGAPIYVHHEIVHNKFVVEGLRSRGAVFVESIAEVPKGAITILSAHGVSAKVENDANDKSVMVLDATCPLVKKVHFEAIRNEKNGAEVILIGHKDHPEVVGTSGRLNQPVLLVENVQDALNVVVQNPDNLAYITQTTLSVDETKDIIATLKIRFPNIIGPDLRDICYATQNRQNAVKDILQKADVLVVIGSKNSSNSNRLRDLAEHHNKFGLLVNNEKELNVAMFENYKSVGLTAGASAPEVLIERVLTWFREHFNVNLSEIKSAVENIKFNIPQVLR